MCLGVWLCALVCVWCVLMWLVCVGARGLDCVIVRVCVAVVVLLWLCWRVCWHVLAFVGACSCVSLFVCACV